jgi:hypothetical protein
MSEVVDLSRMLASLRSPCRMPFWCRNASPEAMSSRHRYTFACGQAQDRSVN